MTGHLHRAVAGAVVLALGIVVAASRDAAHSQDLDLDLPPGIFMDTEDGPQEVGV